MINGLNPWISMWTNPRATIRAIVNINPKFGVFYLALIYALKSNLFFSNYWSLGLSFPFYAIFLASVLLAPLFGMIWVYFAGWVLYFTGEWLGGKAPMAHLRAAVAWSKIPSFVSILMWLVLLIANAEITFIHVGSGPSSVFMSLISLILGIWSLVLLVQSVREVQGFSAGRSFINVMISWVISSIITFLIVLFVSYVYAAF